VGLLFNSIDWLRIPQLFCNLTMAPEPVAFDAPVAAEAEATPCQAPVASLATPVQSADMAPLVWVTALLMMGGVAFADREHRRAPTLKA
jgi:hypothetical protein